MPYRSRLFTQAVSKPSHLALKASAALPAPSSSQLTPALPPHIYCATIMTVHLHMHTEMDGNEVQEEWVWHVTAAQGKLRLSYPLHPRITDATNY